MRIVWSIAVTFAKWLLGEAPMPLVTKASRRVRKPAWQSGLRVPDKAQRDSLAIAANHERKLSGAFYTLLRQLVSDELLKQISIAAREQTVTLAMSKIQFFDESNPETFAIWKRFADRIASAYRLIINETIENENRKYGWKLSIEKVESPTLPVNPSAADFIRIKSLKDAVGLSESEKKRIRAILTKGMEERVVPASMVDEIRDTVGLTETQLLRVQKRVAAAKASGMKSSQLKVLREQMSDKIRLQRARAIARTETTAAISQGLSEAWRQASNNGLAPPETKKRWVAVPDASEICQDLDGQEVGLNENFFSSAGQGFSGDGPPAHPNCRSTVVLIFP